MALSFEIRDSTIRFITVGDVDFESGLETLRQGFIAAETANTAESAQWHLLFDIRESTENRQSQELHDIAQLIQERMPMLSGRCAVVADDPLHFGLARIFAAFTDGLGLLTAVRHSREEAESWLNSDEQP